jgi:spermidine/putrescine transport system substrate-binding protein
MISQKMLQKIDKSKIPNFKNINAALLNKAFDLHNDFSIPYLWGATGIVVNSDYINPTTISSWKNLWNPKYKNQLLILNDLREAFGMALIALGFSADDKNPEHIKQAYLKLKQLLPNIKIFNSDAEQTIYIDEDVVIGMGYNGDIHLSQAENPKINFIFPKDGFVIWIDSLAITKHALHVENAHKFINFLLRPDIAKMVSLTTGYSTPNKEAIKLLPKEVQNLEIINPSADTMKRAELQGDLGQALELYEKYWELLKIGA